MSTGSIEVLVLGFVVGLLIVRLLRRGYPPPLRSFQPSLPSATVSAAPRMVAPRRPGGARVTGFRPLAEPLHPVLIERCRICGGNLAEGEHRHARRPTGLLS